jgi:hypothetical protein
VKHSKPSLTSKPAAESGHPSLVDLRRLRAAKRPLASLFLLVAFVGSLAVVAQTGGPVHPPRGGGGGMSQATADGRYLKLDATNDPVTGNLELGANVTFGDAAADTVTSNAASWTFANDTNMTLTGGVNGLSFDGTTFSIDAANNRVGVGTASPAQPFEVSANWLGGTMRSAQADPGGFSNIDFHMAGTHQVGLGFAGNYAHPLLNNIAYFYSRGKMVIGGGDTAFTFNVASITMDTGYTAFNEENADKDFRVDSDTEEAAFFVDGQTTANLALAADSDIDATTPANFNVTATGNVILSGAVSQVTGSTSAAILAVGSYVEAAADVTISAATNVVIGAVEVLPAVADATTFGSLAAQWSRGFFDDGTTALPSVAVGVDDAGLSYIPGSDALVVSNVGTVYVTTGAVGGASNNFHVEAADHIILDAGGISGQPNADISLSAGASGDIGLIAGQNVTVAAEAFLINAEFARMPRYISTAPVKPACSSTVGGAVIYVDDTDDGNRGIHCACSADSAGAYTWLGIDNLTACPGT